MGQTLPGERKETLQLLKQRDKQATLSIIVCNIQTIGEKRGHGMDRFDAMRAFARVVEAGSFTKAAQTLHMSKTTVTQLIQQLEARLRVKLLHRTTRRLGVTPDGAVYFERVIRLLADMEDA